MRCARSGRTGLPAAAQGAVPGAVHIEWTRNLSPDGDFKPAAELKQMYEEAGVTPEREVITRRYLRHRHSLVRDAISRLVTEEEPDEAAENGMRSRDAGPGFDTCRKYSSNAGSPEDWVCRWRTVTASLPGPVQPGR